MIKFYQPDFISSDTCSNQEIKIRSVHVDLPESISSEVIVLSHKIDVTSLRNV